MINRKLLFVAMLSCTVAMPATAATYVIPLTGSTTNYTASSFDYNGEHYERKDFSLSGLSSANSVTVAQGDEISSTVTFDGLLTIPQATGHNNFLQYFFGSAFPSENTGVHGTFNLFNGTSLVATYVYGSTTSNQLASYAALFPPGNPSVTFDSFTNDFTIDTLATPATLESALFSYDVVSAAVPEPATWAMMILGFAVAGAALRREAKRKFTLRHA